MQANVGYYSTRSSCDPRYESYDGSDYGSTASMERKSTGPWNGVKALNPSVYNPYEYSNTMNGHASFQSDMAPAASRGVQDEVGLHLLYENALVDSQRYSILSISEVDALKKEQERLASRLDGINRKLALESKVKDAAQNLHRLYLVGGAKGRPDTPQSPPSPRRSRGSLLGDKNRDSTGASDVPHSKTLHKAEDELTSSIKKVDELNEVYKTLLERKSDVERQLLSHTAAVLAEQSNKTQAAAASEKLLENQHDSATYDPDEFDGIRDILHGKTRRIDAAPASRGIDQVDQSEQFTGIQKRLEQLNDQLRAVIEDASRSRGIQAQPDTPLDDDGDDISTRLDKRFTKLEYNIRALQQEQEDILGHHAETQEKLRTQHSSEQEQWKAQHVDAQKSAASQQSMIEEQLATINHKLHNTLLLGSDMPDMETLHAPPEATGEGYRQQLEYLDDSVDTVQQLLQNVSKATSLTQKNSDYETTLAGLWDIMQDDEGARSGDATSPGLRQDFSLAAFSSRVQNLHDRATSAGQQHEILRRQIQQQREISGDTEEKDRQLADLQARHTQLSQAHEEVQDQLAEVMAKHAQVETEASRSRTELDNVAKEYEELQKAIDARKKERDEMARQLEQHKINASATEDLESEVVRLTTELTMAKAELDAAAGSRSERAAKEAQAADASRSKELEQELEEMTTEFQELTRESVELEKEREQLDALVDQLRERCEALEAQISDEKVKWMGSNPPRSPQNQENGREVTSVAVMRQEFKKMVRETRAEGFKALKVEQEERRRLEAEVRRLRQVNGPLAKVNGLHTASGTPSVA